MNNTRDPFKKTPEFLAAFSHILEHGFFETFTVEIYTAEGTLLSFAITATGFVPNDSVYMKTGCGAFIDPATAIEKLRTIAEGQKHPNCTCTCTTEVTTKNWPLYNNTDNDSEDVCVIGNRGTQTSLSLRAYFTYSA